MFVRNAQSLMKVLLAAVAGVLLIACANVANLLLVRSTVRKREMAIRAAMGADRSRIIRQLMTESVLLAMIGGTLGLGLGLFGIRGLLSINTAGLPRVGESGSAVALDWRLLLFTAVVSLGTGLLFGLMPAIHAARDDLSGTLRDGAAVWRRRTKQPRSIDARRPRDGTRTGARHRVGVAHSHVTRAARGRPGIRCEQRADDADVVHRSTISNRVRRRPGDPRRRGPIEAAARCGASRVPRAVFRSRGSFGLGFKIVGRPLEQGPWHGGGSWMTASPGYFEVFKIPVIRGRTFAETDTRAAPAVVDHQRVDGEAVLEDWRSHRRAPRDRARRHECIRDGARPADHWCDRG